MAAPQLSIEAYFDCLSIVAAVPKSVAPVTTRELHLFSYLACLLALFEGQPTADWSYTFALTSKGYPHSADFEIARQVLADRGFIDEGNLEAFVPTERGLVELEELRSLSFLSRRRRWLDAAADCSLALPIGSIRYAVTARSDLFGSTGSGQPRGLITSSYIDRVHDERATIERVLGGDSVDLLAPAVTWLSLYVLAGREQVAA